MSDDVTAAAQRLIAEAAIAEREMLYMYSREHRPDYLTVAHAALEAVNDRARLLGEVEALKAALSVELEDAIEEIRRPCARMTPEKIAYYVDGSPRVQRLRAALDAAPAGAGEAVAPGASDAGDGDGER